MYRLERTKKQMRDTFLILEESDGEQFKREREKVGKKTERARKTEKNQIKEIVREQSERE